MLQRIAGGALIVLLVATSLAGCANVAGHRSEISRLREARVVQVVTPALEVPTFFQTAVQRGVLGGAVPAAVAGSDGKVTLAPPDIPDATALLRQKLRDEIQQTARWWPALQDVPGPVPANYVYAGGPWLRVEIVKYYIAATPVKTLHVDAKVSLRRAGDLGDPYWSLLKVYSGLVHGGERLDEDRVRKDGTVLAREIDHATAWLAREIASSIGRMQ